MSIEVNITPEGWDVPTEQAFFPNGPFYYYHNENSGDLILARSLADDEGATIHTLKDFHGHPGRLSMPEALWLADWADRRIQILPFFREVIDITLTTGEPAKFSVQHRPDTICVYRVRSITSEPD